MQGQFYFLWLFLFSLHSVVDQIGAAAVTCQRNVPALSSVSDSTRTGVAAARCRPLKASRAEKRLTGALAEQCARECVVCVCVPAPVCEST